jgi:hypothetical protein
MSATLRAVDSRSGDCGNDGFLLCDQLSSLSSRKFHRGEITTLIRPAEIIRDLQRAPTLATLRAIDSRSGDCGNDEVFYSAYKCWQLYALQIPAQKTAGMTRFLLCDQLSSRSSRKFRRGEITTLIRPAEIIRDLQRVQMLAILHAIDSRLGDCGNDGIF